MIDASDGLPELWALCPISAVSLVRIYYVLDARNAWHGTWVRRYYSSSFHVEWERARWFAENMRVQGSVFTIVELPAVSYASPLGSLLVSELNATCPLKEFNPPMSEARARTRGTRCSWWFREHTLPIQLKRHRALTYPQVGWPVIEINESFEPNAIAWKAPENWRTVVRLLAPAEADVHALPLLPRERLRIWRSESIGRQYSLRWHDGKGLSQAASARVAKCGQPVAGEIRVRQATGTVS